MVGVKVGQSRCLCAKLTGEAILESDCQSLGKVNVSGNSS
jgi:hypothetical protein